MLIKPQHFTWCILNSHWEDRDLWKYLDFQSFILECKLYAKICVHRWHKVMKIDLYLHLNTYTYETVKGFKIMNVLTSQFPEAFVYVCDFLSRSSSSKSHGPIGTYWSFYQLDGLLFPRIFLKQDHPEKIHLFCFLPVIIVF